MTPTILTKPRGLLLAALTFLLALATALPARADGWVPETNTLDITIDTVYSVEREGSYVLINGEGGPGAQLWWAHGRSRARVGTFAGVHGHAGVRLGAHGVLLADGRNLQRWTMDGELLWSRDTGGTIEEIHKSPTYSSRVIVTGRNANAPVQTWSVDGTRNYVAPVRGLVEASSLSPDGKRLILAGVYLQVDGGKGGPHLAMIGVNGNQSFYPTGYNAVKANLMCGRKNPDLAYITDVEWGPSGTPAAGLFAFTATGGGWYNSTTGYCDGTTLMRGRGNLPSQVREVWYSTTCADTLHSVAWRPDGQQMIVQGHHKCNAWTATFGDVPGFDFGPDPDNPYEVKWPRDEMLQTNAMGVSVLRLDGTLVPTYPDTASCRGEGGRASVWDNRGIILGRDCAFWGNREKRYVLPEHRWYLPVPKAVFIADPPT